MNDKEFCDSLKLYSDRISNVILHMDVEWIDVEIQINEMREFCRMYAPDKLGLFEMIYTSRFRRLWDTWGADSREPDWLFGETELGV